MRLSGTRYNPLNWLDDDFAAASSAVRLGSYTSVKRPAERAAAPALQTMVMTLPDGGAAAEIAARAAALQLPVSVQVTAGPASAGDAAELRAMAQAAGGTVRTAG